jgi:hypothetical protein
MRTRRGWALAEIVVAVALGIVLVGVATAEIARQHAELRVATEGARARAELLATYERLRVGLLEAPAEGSARELAGSDSLAGLALQIEGLPAPDPRVQAVRISASWPAGIDGQLRRRSLTTLVHTGGAR